MFLLKPKDSKSKQKIINVHCCFQKGWELLYFRCKINNKIVSLICKSAISSKLYNINQYHEQNKSKYNKNEELIK